MFEWLRNVTFYPQYQTERGRRLDLEKEVKVWSTQNLELFERIKRLEASQSEHPVFNPPVLSSVGRIRTNKQVQDVILDRLSGRGFSFDAEDHSYHSAPISDIRDVMVPFIQKYMFPWLAEFRDCDNQGRFMAACFGMWFARNCCYPVKDYKGEHMYDLVVPDEDELWILEPDKGALIGTPPDNLVKFEFHQFLPGYQLQGGKIYMS